MISTFLKTHERLLLIGVGILALTLLGYRWVSHIAAVDAERATVSQQQLADQTASNKRTADSVQKMESLSEQLVNQLTQQNAQLLQTISSRNQVTIVQQQKDQTLPLPDLAKRWQGLAGLAPTDLSNQGSSLTVTDAGARSTVQKLELVPTLQATIQDGKQLLDNKDKQIADGQELITGYKSQVSGLQLANTDADKACKAQITSVKASARKGKWKWFGVGVGVGIGIVVEAVTRLR